MSDVFASMAAPFLDFEAKGKADLPMADDAKLRTDNPLDSGGTWAGIAVRRAASYSSSRSRVRRTPRLSS